MGAAKSIRSMMPMACSILLACLAVLLPVGCDYSKTSKNTVGDDEIRVGYMPYTSDLALFVAIENGYFQQEHISPRLTMFRSTTDNVNALVSGRVDVVGIIGAPTLYAQDCEAEGKVKMFLPAVETEQRYAASLLVPISSPYKNIQDLKGHTVGTYTGTTQALNLKYILGKFMDPEKDVTVVQVSSELQLNALAAGQFDALLTIEPHVTIAVAKKLGRVLEPNPRCKYIMSPFPASAQAVSTDFLDSHRPIFLKYYRALRKALSFIESNPEGAKAILPKYTDLEPDIAAQSNMYQWQFDEKADIQRFQDLADLYFDKGILTRKVNVQDMWVPRSIFADE